MDITAATQIAATVSNIIFFLVFVVAYYKMIKLYRRMVEFMERERTALGRPQVIVDTDYSSLPEVDIVVRNISDGAAKEITFEFSAPIESSDGTVISDLSYFDGSLDFLAPDGEVSCYWDHLDTLLPFLREKGLTEGITVVTRYKDLAGEYYSTEWNLNPFIYENRRYVHHKGIENLVDAVEKLAAEGDGGIQPRKGPAAQE